MIISEIKKWAKANGYSIIKEQENNTFVYYWSKDNDISVTGVASSVSKVATCIFNHMTDNKWVDHQKEYYDTLIKPTHMV
jgi:hypothetical protein